MTDEPFVPHQPQLMSAVRARNLARHFKGFAISLRNDGFTREANQAERDSLWWMSYADQAEVGAVDPNDAA